METKSCLYLQCRWRSNYHRGLGSHNAAKFRHISCLTQARSWILNSLYRGLFIALIYVGIVDDHCLSFLFNFFLSKHAIQIYSFFSKCWKQTDVYFQKCWVVLILKIACIITNTGICRITRFFFMLCKIEAFVCIIFMM